MEKAESQGQRLSSYASSSSNKYSPKTPKKSTEKLSAHSTSKEESLSPHHLMSGYSFTSINSHSKEINPECALKCTCNSSFNSLKSVKSSGGLGVLTVGGAAESSPGAGGSAEKTVKVSKISCDAATSPNRYSNQKSLQPNLRLINSKKPTMCNELRISDDKKVTNKASLSPRRLITTRNAATSPHMDIRKHANHELLPKSPEISGKVQLEKSNSLGESKPSRPLRTTRSLSPRPPVRHQHAIMVSDENDIVSVKVSPNEDFDTELSKQAIDARVKKKHKAQSEQTSPNLSEYSTSFSYDKGTNKSTSCLVYVPSDPWLKMSDVDGGGASTLGKDETKRRISKISQETRSLSRGNLEPLDAGDPWIWRKPNTALNQANPIRSPKQEAYRQTKSFSTTKFEIGDSNKQISLVATDPPSNAKPLNRPKLQRCKSPLIGDDEKDAQLSCTCNSTPTANDLKTPSASPGTHQPQVRKDDYTAIQPSKTFLSVINPNLIQSRHSFSSISQKDDELQLNIRRLSEQIKHNTPRGDVPATGGTATTTAGGADFSEYLSQFRSLEAQKFTKSPKNTSKKSESVLETTC